MSWENHFQRPKEGSVYLNNAGTGQLPLTTAEEGRKALSHKETPWRSDEEEEQHEGFSNDIKFSSSRNVSKPELVRHLFAELVRAESSRCIAFAPSTSFAMSLAAQNILQSGALSRPSRVLITEGEEDSNVYPWQNICKHPQSQSVLQVVRRPSTLGMEGGTSWGDAVIEKLQEKSKLGPVAVVAMSYLHWCDGALLGVKEIATYIKSLPPGERPYFVIDGTQTIGVVPFDVMEINADFVACSVHKWLLSPYGTSIMYLNPRHHDTWNPLDNHERSRLGSEQPEWDEIGTDLAVHDQDFYSTNAEYYPTTFVCGARRINCGGHPNPVNFSMIAESLRLITQWSVHSIQSRITSLSDHLISCLESKSSDLGLSILPKNIRSGHIIGLGINPDVMKLTAHELMQRLNKAGMFVSIRHSVVRVSPYAHNTYDDMERFALALEKIILSAQAEWKAKPKKVFLLIGGSGWLGQQLVRGFREFHCGEHALSDSHTLHITYNTLKPFFVPPTQSHQLDLTSPSQCHELISMLRPDIIVNVAAMSSPAACAKTPDVASTINCPIYLFDAIEKHAPQALTLVTSTDLVYRGDKAPCFPSLPSDLPVPSTNNIYGSTKLSCEKEVCKLQRGLVFRLSNMVGGNFVYALPGKGGMKFLSWVQRSLEMREAASLKNDEYRSFVLSGDVVNLLLQVCLQYATGGITPSHPCWTQRVYNVGGPKGLSRLEFAKLVASAQNVSIDHQEKVSKTEESQPNRDVWNVVSMTSLQLAAGMQDPSSLQEHELRNIQEMLPPKDVTMNSSLTEEHFGVKFRSVEYGLNDCLEEV